MLTSWSHACLAESLNPLASLPNIQKVGEDKSVWLSEKSVTSPSAAVPLTTRPWLRASPAVVCMDSTRSTGIWKTDPALARTLLGLKGSALPGPRNTASAPAASAVRTTTPTLPGSWACSNPITRRGSDVQISVRGAGIRATPTSPCGVRVSLIPEMTRSSTTSTSTPAASTRSTSSGNRASPVGETNTRSSRLARNPYSTDCGPSARKSCSASRTLVWWSFRAALTTPEDFEAGRRTPPPFGR